MDGLPDGAGLRFGEAFAEKSRTGLRLLGDSPSVLHLHKEGAAGDLELLVQQEPRPVRIAAELPGATRALAAWLADEDRELPISFRHEGDRTRFDLELPPYGSVVVARRREPGRREKAVSFGGPFV